MSMSYRLKVAMVVAVVVLLLVVAGNLLIKRFQPVAEKPLDLPPRISLQNVDPNFRIQSDATVSTIKVRKDKGVLYQANGQHMDAVKEFLQTNPTYEGSDGKRLFPDTIAQDAQFKRSQNDSDNPTYKRLMHDTSEEHYFYEQTVHGIPVYGSHLTVHLRNNNEIYDVDGILLTNGNLPAILVSNERAIEVAKEAAKKDAETAAEFTAGATTKYVFNRKLLNLAPTDTNHLVLEIPITGADFGANYLVDLSSGAVVFSTPLQLQARQRSELSANSCSVKNLAACKVIRSEGQPATGDNEADKAYDIVGKVYDYFHDTYGRDSFDGAGGALRILPHYKPLAATDVKCPNAFWLPRSGYPESAMVICDGMVAPDVVAHEMTHGITEFTAGLKMFAQAGALNEAISDIFGYAIDPNWSMGETTSLGPVRYFDNPTKLTYTLKTQEARQPMPDRLTAQGYLCPANVADPASCMNTKYDYCGVHINATIIDKAFYLMTAGGSFNGCTIRGLGADKTLPIIYRTQTSGYLASTSNFRDFYDGVNKACKDLYENSSDCAEVEAAMQAVELDKQGASDYVSPVCRGQSVGTATCADRTPSTGGGGTEDQPDQPKPTDTPVPTPTTKVSGSSGATDTPAPTGSTVGSQLVTGNCSGNQAQVPTIIGPKGKVKQGSIVFSWKTSKVQNGFYFRLLFNRDPKNQKDPEVIMDNWQDNKINQSQLVKNGKSVTLPLGKHAWWVHSLCDGKLTDAKGADFEVIADTSSNGQGQGQVPFNSTVTPTPTPKPTSPPAQGQGIIDFK